MTSLSPDPLLAPALVCIDEFYARMFRDWPTAVTRHEDNCTLSFSGDRHLTGANHLWPHTPDALTHRALDIAEEFFTTHAAAWSVMYIDTFLPRAATLLGDRGYFPRWSSPLMVLDRAPHPLPVRADTTVIRATTPRHLDDVTRVMAEAFATGDSVNQRVVRATHLNDPAIIHYLVYADGEPAGCATVALHAGMAGIWNVGTRHVFRRQGYASTIMLGLLDDLRAYGYRASALMASPSGQPLYERLGYRHVALVTYMGPPFIRKPRPLL